MSWREELALRGRPLEIVDPPNDLPRAPAPPGEGDPAPRVFALDRASLDRKLARRVASASADRIAWVADPTAGPLGTEPPRDSLAGVLPPPGLRPGTPVAIGTTGSALRVRPAPDR